MNDVEWLDRVWHAYQVYQKKFGTKDLDTEDFVTWLYREYGILTPKQREQRDRSA